MGIRFNFFLACFAPRVQSVTSGPPAQAESVCASSLDASQSCGGFVLRPVFVGGSPTGGVSMASQRPDVQAAVELSGRDAAVAGCSAGVSGEPVGGVAADSIDDRPPILARPCRAAVERAISTPRPASSVCAHSPPRRQSRLGAVSAPASMTSPPSVSTGGKSSADSNRPYAHRRFSGN